MRRTQQLVIAFTGILLPHIAVASTTLALKAVSTSPLTLELTASSTAGQAPAGLQWTLGFSAASVSGVDVAAGPALTAASKTISCLNGLNGLKCIATGLNTNQIGDGVIATVSVSPVGVSAVNAALSSISLRELVAADPNGGSVPISAASSAIASNLTVNSLSCAPAVLPPLGSAVCTVALNAQSTVDGVAVALTSTSANLSVPNSVPVSKGASAAVFTATANAYTVAQAATLSASLNGTATSTTVNLASVLTVSAVRCAVSDLNANKTTTCTVTLSKAAPAGGTAVFLSSSTAAVTVPSSVTVPVNGTTATFTATAGALSSSGSATITATVASFSQTSVLALARRVTGVQCAPGTVTGNQSVTCTVTLSSAADAAAVSISSSNAALKTPAATVTVPSGMATATFTMTAASVSTDQVAIVTASFNGVSGRTSVAIQSPPRFYFRGNNTELSVLATGSAVTPTISPDATWKGQLTVKGRGFAAFSPVVGTSGIAFSRGGAQNADTAFIGFSGTQTGQLFAKQGDVTFMLKSAYSVSERQALPAPNVRYAFSVFDAAGAQFGFYSYTSGGVLTFGYTTNGATMSYVVPGEQADKLFGAGVVLDVRLAWTETTSTLYLNGAAVKTMTYSPATPKWTSASALTIGSSNSQPKNNGYFASDDAIAEIQIR